MSVLVLQRVTKRFAEGRREAVALCDVSLDIACGELVAVWGLRRSGRTTLLRVASGMLVPDEGIVAFEGRNLAEWPGSALGTEIGFANSSFNSAQGGKLRDHVAVGLLAQGVPRQRACDRADDALERAGAPDCANRDPRDLHPAELVRAGIARAIVSGPRLLLIDEPTNGVDMLERDPIVDLVRSLADEGMAVLMTTGETLDGPDRTLVLDRGELHGNHTPADAPVVPLRRSQAGPST